MALLSELALIFILFVCNGIFAMAELAVVSAKRTRLQQMAQRGDANAQAALALTEEPTSFLSTVQIGITLIGILAGAIGGATLSEEFERIFAGIPFLAGSAAGLGFTATVILTTYLSLVVGELVPKRLALGNPELIASRIARPMRLLSFITRPAVRLLTLSTNALLKLLRVSADQSNAVTEEDLVAMLRESAGSGELEHAESELVERALRLDDIWLASVMTPYPDIVWLDVNDDIATLHQKLVEHGHSRYPVIDGSPDHILGVVRAQDILQLALQRKGNDALDLRRSLHTPQYLPLNTTPVDALEYFRQNDIHVVLLIDEYSNIKGLLTPMDILEAMVGDLSTASAEDDPDVVRREDGSWLLAGTLYVDELEELLKLPEDADWGIGTFQTLGGLVMAQLGRVPQTGDQFTWQGYHFEVVDMDKRRVDRVLVRSMEQGS